MNVAIRRDEHAALSARLNESFDMTCSAPKAARLDKSATMAAALDMLIDEIARRVAAQLREEHTVGSQYVDQTTAPIDRAAFLRAARAGHFASWRSGKRVLAKRADVVAWLESNPNRARAPRVVVEVASDGAKGTEAARVDALLGRMGLVRRQ